MRITKKLPQFGGEEALLMVLGEQEGKLYKAGSGRIENIHAFKVEPPRYSDREGFFATRGKIGTIRSGAPYENKKEKTQEDFLKEVSLHLREIMSRYVITKVYIFVPSNLKNRIRARVSPAFKKEDETVIEGNYLNHHPFDLIKVIQSRISPLVKPVGDAVQKILKHPRKRKS